jgi:predicted RNase H-like HicB family nuclease
MDLTVRVHHEEGSYWAEVVELPGCFATGDTLDELKDGIEEAARLYLQEEGSTSEPAAEGRIEVAEMKLTDRQPQAA